MEEVIIFSNGRPEGYLTVSEYAEKNGVGRHCAWQWVQRGKIEAIRDVNGRIWIREGTTPKYKKQQIAIGRKLASKDAIDKMIEMRKKGKTVSEIVAEVKLSRATVSKYTSGIIPYRNKKYGYKIPEKIKDDIVKMRKEGVTMSQIAKTFEVSCATVSRIIKKRTPE